MLFVVYYELREAFVKSNCTSINFVRLAQSLCHPLGTWRNIYEK